jgi:hypothetical protein
MNRLPLLPLLEEGGEASVEHWTSFSPLLLLLPEGGEGRRRK